MLLEVKNLKVSFRLNGQKKEALRGVSFFLKEGEVYCLLGESGSGKTMILRCIMGLLPPNAEVSGSVFFEGKDLLSLPESEKIGYRGKAIGMVFQEPMTALNPTMRVGEQVAEVLKHHFGMEEEEAKKRVVKAFEELEIPDPEERYYYYPHLLSGGMRQRVVIAMATVANPKLILADEPTTALDVTVQAQILKLLKKLVDRKKTSMLFVTHDVSVAAEIGNRIGVLYRGTLVEEGTLEEVLSDPKHPYTVSLIESVPLPDTRPLKVVKVSESKEESQGCPYAPRCTKALDVCYKEVPPWRTVKEGHRVRCFNT